jgi:hypothetical protein
MEKDLEIYKEKEAARISGELALIKERDASGQPDMGTPEQMQNYYSLLESFSGNSWGGNGAYANDPLKAYNYIIGQRGKIEPLVGTQLYEQLLNDVGTLAKSQPAEKPMSPTAYKTDPDFATNINYINDNPETALSEIQNNADQLILDYGYDGYKALVNYATAAQKAASGE